MTTTQDPFDLSGMMAGLNTGNGNMAPQQHQQAQPQYQQLQQQQQQQLSQSFVGGQNQLVVATQQSNPYGMVAAGGVPPPASDQLNSSYVVPPPTRSSTASAASFDPFAAPPPPPQQQESFLVPQQQLKIPFPPPPPQSQEFSLAPPPQQQQYQAPPQAPQGFSVAPETQIVLAQAPQQYQKQQQQEQQMTYSNSSNYGNDNRSLVSAPPTTVVVHDDDDDDGSKSASTYNQQNSGSPRNPYSNALAVQVQGSNSAGLPKAALVGKRGFVLSRISFRTIVMKKWKQSFWVQYGGHTMLWFRSQGDFDDWLNNPYHTQMQRNFLVKLAVNFVHDLYKPNVRGYQVTQCRTKPYGKNKVIRQFKLERWMDYGPTIAAAFGSYDPKEVDACREAIVECMKNTPLDNGIRATGAVKEHHDQLERAEEEQESQQLNQQKQQSQTGAGGSNAYQNYRLDDNCATSGRAQSMVAPVVDLLGDNSVSGGFDDSASLPPRSSMAVTDDLLFGHVGNGALVPAINPDVAYPGALPPSTYNPPTSQPAIYQTQLEGYPPQGYSQYTQPQAPQQQQQQQQADYGGYHQQPQQQAGYPAASYPQPVQQF